MGTKASNDEYVRLLAVPITRFSVMSITKARTNVSIILRIFFIRNDFLLWKRRKNQYLYKPGSVLEKPVPYHLSKRSTLHRVPKNSGEQPFHDDDIHELAASSRHSIVVTNYLVVSYTTFSPLPSTLPPFRLHSAGGRCQRRLFSSVNTYCHQ